MTIAIMSAMQEEIVAIVDAMEIDAEHAIGSRTYYSGKLFGHEVVVVFSHWGKVAAAITTTTLITKFSPEQIIFTGVAGAIDAKLSIGDIVIGNHFYQHDMDASPIIERHEIPLLGRAEICASSEIQKTLEKAACEFIEKDMAELLSDSTLSNFSISAPKVSIADIASGDQFVSDSALAEDISARLPSVACVEMEGAAVAQVCEAFAMPFGVVRTISDKANEVSEFDFPAFIQLVAQVYSLGVVRRYIGLR